MVTGSHVTLNNIIGISQACRAWWGAMASLVGVQTEVAEPGQDDVAVTQTPWSNPSFCFLQGLLCPTAFLHSCNVYAGMCIFLILLLIIYMFLFLGLLYAFSSGFLVTCECSFPCGLALPYVFCLTITAHYWALQLFTRQSNPLLSFHWGGCWHCCVIGSDVDHQVGLGVRFPSVQLCRGFLPIWAFSYLYCEGRALAPCQSGCFSHPLFARQFRDVKSLLITWIFLNVA